MYRSCVVAGRSTRAALYRNPVDSSVMETSFGLTTKPKLSVVFVAVLGERLQRRRQAGFEQQPVGLTASSRWPATGRAARSSSASGLRRLEVAEPRTESVWRSTKTFTLCFGEPAT